MRIQHHFLISYLAGSVYLFLTAKPINLIALLPWLTGGVLVDIDHAFTYTAKNKTFRLKKLARLISEDYRSNNQHFYIFHTIEFIICFSFIIAKTFLTWQFLASFLLHLFCDGIRHKKMKKNYSWLKKWSLAYYFKSATR